MALIPLDGTTFVVLSAAVCAVYGLRFLFLGLRSSRSADWILRNRASEPGRASPQRKIVLCCPLYAESDWIGSLVQQLAALEYDPDLLRIVFVTNHSDETGTRDVLSRELSEKSLPYQTDSLAVAGENKAESLNAAVNTVASRYSEWIDDDTYVGVFDVDTRIQRDMVQYVGADDETPAAYTGTSVYGLHLVEDTVRSRLLQAFAVMQTQWALGFEFRRVVNDYRKGRHKLQYIVGHGSFYRWDIVDEYGFPGEADDIPLGYLITAQGHRIKPLPSVEFVGVPVTVRDLIDQVGTWFRANYLMFRFRRYVDGIPPKLYPNLLYEPFVSPIPWIVGPVLLVASVVYLGVVAPTLALAGLLWVGLTAQVSGLVTYRSMRRLKPDAESVLDAPAWATPFLAYSFLKAAGAWHRVAMVVLGTLGIATDASRSTPKGTGQDD